MAKGQSSSHPALPLGQTLPLQHIPQQPPIPSKSGPPNFPPAQPQSLASLSVQPTPTLSLSRDPMPQILPPVLQQNRETLVSANLVPQPQFNLPTASVQHSHLPRRLLSQVTTTFIICEIRYWLVSLSCSCC